MSKLGTHFEQTTNWMRRTRTAALYEKIINPPEDNVFPGKLAIGRVFMTDGEEGSLYSRGKIGAGTYFDRCLGWYQRAPYIHAWEGPNEPAMIKTPVERMALDEFSAEWVRLCHSIGLKTVVGNFSDRNPPDGTIREFERMLATSDYLGGHYYDAPSMQSHGYCLRYEQIIAEIDDAGLRVPPLLIGECGIDGGVIGKGGRGWQKFCSWEQYLADLQWYERHLSANDDVAGAFLFTAGASSKWTSFNVNEKQIAQFAAWQIEFDKTLPEPKPPEPPPSEDSPLAFISAPLPVQTEKLRWFLEDTKRQMERGEMQVAESTIGDLIPLAYEVERKTH